MTVGGIKPSFDHLKAANMTGIEHDLGVMDGADLDTGAGGGLRQGGAEGGEGGRETTAEGIYVWAGGLRSQESCYLSVGGVGGYRRGSGDPLANCNVTGPSARLILLAASQI